MAAVRHNAGKAGRIGAQSASGHLPKQLGGSTPAASTPHRGARFAFDAMKHRSAVAGVDPASSHKLPGATAGPHSSATGNGHFGAAAARRSSAARTYLIGIHALPVLKRSLLPKLGPPQQGGPTALLTETSVNHK